jgi:phytoene dehydrogenase-like protein
MSPLDAIVIGAGTNGLAAAAYLARAGRRVLVLERRPEVGGIAVTQELHPGFRFSTCAPEGSRLAPEVGRELGLAAHGLEWLPADPVVFAPQPDGSQLTIWRDTARTAEEIARFSTADARRYPDFVRFMRRLADVVGGLQRAVPPDLPDLGWAGLRGLLPLAAPLRRLGRRRVGELLRVLPMSVADLLNEWFESDALKAAIAASALRDVTWGPKEAGTAYTLLFNWALAESGLFRAAGLYRGGAGAVALALAAAARAAGAEIRTGTAVERLWLESGRVAGVELAGGERVAAAAVVSSADPRTTFFGLCEPRLLPAAFVRHVRSLKSRGSLARIHLALSALPEFTAVGRDEGALRLAGAIQVAPSISHLQRAYDCTKYGEFSSAPYLDLWLPTLRDPGLAPAGQHVLSISAKFAPYRLRQGSWAERREAFAEVVLETLSGYAPKLRDLVRFRATKVPPDFEAEFGVPEGNLCHAEMTLDQFFHMRPIPGHARYRGPLPGLYLCGASCHPGGVVNGIPSRNAARELLRDRRRPDRVPQDRSRLGYGPPSRPDGT